jgi:uncharacterized membrane protein
MPTLNKISLSVFWFLCIGVAVVSWRFIPFGVEAMGHIAYHADIRPVAFYAHVGLAPAALVLMPFQLRPWLRAARPALHRWMGRLYAGSVAIAGSAGLVLALGTESGATASAGFAAMSVLWLASTALGVAKARAGDITSHRAWMFRSAALTFAAVTLRLELPILVAGSLEYPTAYSIVAWLCWVPNLLAAELVLRWGPPGGNWLQRRTRINRSQSGSLA